MSLNAALGSTQWIKIMAIPRIHVISMLNNMIIRENRDFLCNFAEETFNYEQETFNYEYE
jgi:hypothetical protein